MSYLVLTLLLGALTAWSWQREPRRLRNGVLLLVTGWFALSAVLTVLIAVAPVLVVVPTLLLLAVPFSVVVLAGFLVANGVTVMRREGVGAATALPVLAGVALVAVPAAALALALLGRTLAIGAAALLLLVSGYLGVAFLAFLVCALAYGRVGAAVHPDAVVVLGSGLIGDRVPPLLASRLTRALEVYRRERAVGRSPLLVPSGGQGEDEGCSEGAAMAAWLAEHGVPPDDLAAETEARNTRENLSLSQAVIEERGRAGTVLVVTSSYHVLRAAVFAREAGSDAQVIGAPTARWFVPSAFLREFAAVLTAHRRLHVLLLAPLLLLTVAVTVSELPALT